MNLSRTGRWIGIGIGTVIVAGVAILLFINFGERHAITLPDGRTLRLEDVTMGDEAFIDSKPVLRRFWRAVLDHTNVVAALSKFGIEAPGSIAARPISTMRGMNSAGINWSLPTNSIDDVTFWWKISPDPMGDSPAGSDHPGQGGVKPVYLRVLNEETGTSLEEAEIRPIADRQVGPFGRGTGRPAVIFPRRGSEIGSGRIVSWATSSVSGTAPGGPAIAVTQVFYDGLQTAWYSGGNVSWFRMRGLRQTTKSVAIQIGGTNKLGQWEEMADWTVKLP